MRQLLTVIAYKLHILSLTMLKTNDSQVYVGKIKRGMVLSKSWVSRENSIAARAESKLASLYSD